MNLDPQSKALWEELLALEEQLCCKVMKQHLATGIDTLISYDAQQQPRCRLKINYCPKCGKKLK